MACTKPFPVWDPVTKCVAGRAPCGYCLNCIVDTRNRYVDECTEEAMKRPFMAYVTLTYDKYHLPYKRLSTGEQGCTLSRKAVPNFNKRLREWIKRHCPASVSVPGIQRDFKFFYSAEYGETNTALPRAHYHIIYFGLDYRMAAKAFRECWRFGEVKILPVKQGCFRYVASYLTKQVKCYSNPRDAYESKGRRRPFCSHSKRFGSTLYERQLDFIKSHDYCYRSSHGKLRPVPMYIRQKYMLYGDPMATRDKLRKLSDSYARRTGKHKAFSLSEYDKCRSRLAKERETLLLHQFMRSGEPIVGYFPEHYRENAFKHDKFGSPSRELMRALDTEQHFENTAVMRSPYVQSIFRSDLDKIKSLYPSYKSLRAIHDDLNKYGDVIPF